MCIEITLQNKEKLCYSKYINWAKHKKSSKIKTYIRDINTTHSTCNERGGLMSFTLSVVGNKSKALFALSVDGNISTQNI